MESSGAIRGLDNIMPWGSFQRSWCSSRETQPRGDEDRAAGLSTPTPLEECARDLHGRQWFFLFEIFYCICVILVKLSISFMLIRVAGPMEKYRHTLYAVSAIFTIMNLIALFYIVFQCQPVSYVANPPPHPLKHG